MSRYQRQLLRFPPGVNDNADTGVFTESRLAALIGLTPKSGIGKVAFWKKRIQLNALFPPSGAIQGVFQYTGTAIANDKIILCKNGVFYSCSISCNAPQLTPDALNFTSTALVAIPNYSGIAFTNDTTHRVRAAQLNSEMVFVQEGGIAPVRYNGTAIYKLGITTPSAPTFGGFIAGVLQIGAAYNYAVTYADELGRESSPSTNLTVSVAGGGGVHVNWTAPADAQVQTVYLYRTTANQTTKYRVVEAGFNPAITGYNDNTVTDTAITFNTIAPFAFENDPPQPASLVSIYKFRLALNNANNPRELQISNQNAPGSYSLTGPIYNSVGLLLNATDGVSLNVLNEFGDEITAVGHLGSVLGVWNRRTTGIFEGDNPAQFQFRLIHRIGCIAPDSVCECGNSTVFMAEDGLYALDYQSGFSITRLSQDLDNLFRSAAVEFDSSQTWPPTQFFTRQVRAKAAIAVYMQNTYILATPPYTVCFDFDTNTLYEDYMTGMPYGDGSLSNGYLCMSRIFADRQYQVALFSPGIGFGTTIGDLYVMSAYPLTQSSVGVPEYNPFIIETRAMDGGGVARTRLKRFKRVTLFGKIAPATQADGTVTAAALINGNISFTMDDGYVFGPYPFDNISQAGTQFVGADFAKLAIQGKLIEQEWPVDAVGRACQVLITGQANGRLSVGDLLVEYSPVDGD